VTDSDSGGIRLVADGRRFRAMLAGRTLADSVRAQLLCEPGRHPVIYFPPSDVRSEFLSDSGGRSRCPRKGEATLWRIRLDGRDVPAAAWSYETPEAGLEAIAGHLAFEWKTMESFWQEDQRLLAHPRNPFVRIDTLATRRRVVVRCGAEVLADSNRAVLLFETGLPVRYYLPRADVAVELLAPSDARSVCPYKGEAAYFDARLPGRRIAGVAWHYPEPFAEVALIRACVCFYPERVDAIEIAES